MAKQLLKQVKIASPCQVAWSEMQGDDRTRYCKHCKLNVYNLSDMTDREAEAFIRNATGRTCISYFERADGTILTRDCPVGLSAIRRRFAIGLVSAAALVVSAFGLAVRPKQDKARDVSPQASSTGLSESVDYWQKASDWLMNSKPKEEPVRLVYGSMPVLPPSTSGLFKKGSSPPP
jgi:hypothetical protein